MCDSLSYGFDFECNDGVGGIKAGSLLLAEWDNISSYTATGGVVTVLNQEASTYFYRYQVRKYIAGDTTNGVNDPLTGTRAYTSALVFTLFNISAEKNTELETLMSKPVVAIYQDNRDKWHVLGIKFGAEVKTIDRQTGVAMTEMNGYTITVTHEEDAFPYEVQASVISGLDISGNLS